MRKPIRILVAVAAIVVAGYVVASVSRDDAPAVRPITDTGHGDVKIGKSDSKRILNAVDAITTEAPNDTLVAQGREIFRDTSLFEAGESCQTCHAEGAASAKLGTMVHDKNAPTDCPKVFEPNQAPLDSTAVARSGHGSGLAPVPDSCGRRFPGPTPQLS